MAILEWRLYEAGFCTHPERATRRDAGLQACEFPALVPVLRHAEHSWILFDTGYSEHFLKATSALPERLYRVVTPVHLPPQGTLASQLRRDGVAPADVAWVLLSHMHGDHVGGLADFPQARLACARAAWDDLHAHGRIGALRRGLLPSLLHGRQEATVRWFEALPRRRLPAALHLFDDGYDLFGDGSLLLVPLPGHAPGHYGAVFDDGKGPVFLVADASWSSQAIRDNVPPPAAVTGWLGDTATYRETLARLHALHRASPEVRIVPSHCRDWRPSREPRA